MDQTSPGATARSRARIRDISAIAGCYGRVALALEGGAPGAKLAPGEAERIWEQAKSGDVNIVQLIDRHKEYQGRVKHYEFSGASMRKHCRLGYDGPARALGHSEWLQRASIRHGVAVRAPPGGFGRAPIAAGRLCRTAVTCVMETGRRVS